MAADSGSNGGARGESAEGKRPAPGAGEPPLSLRLAEWTLFGLLVAWLLAAAVLVETEYYDGYSAISNARYFLGLADEYIADRAPLMAILLMPAEWIKERLQLHPLDVRPHHLSLAMLHIAYLAAAYRGLTRCCGRSWAALVAFVAAVPNFVFFSYAPFLSHDLLPGVLLLWMLLLAGDFLKSGGWIRWGVLVALGAAAPLFKQTYGLFWMLVLLANLRQAIPRSSGEAAGPRRWWWLCGGAVLSGTLVWITLGAVFAGWAPHVPLWLRPAVNLWALAHVHAGKEIQFPLWIYLRNLPAYGWLTALLLLPGLVQSLRGSASRKSMAVAWIGAAVFVHAMPLREVRYFAFLAPLSACVLFPVIRTALESSWGRVLLAGVLLVDLGRVLPEAALIADDFYRRSEIRTFLEPLRPETGRRPAAVCNVAMLSFVSPRPSPLAGDRYHRVFNFGVHHIRALYGYTGDELVVAAAAQEFEAHLVERPDGTLVLYSSEILARGPAWTPGPPPGIGRFFQFVAEIRSVELRRGSSGRFVTGDGQPVEVAQLPEGGVTIAVERQEGAFTDAPAAWFVTRLDQQPGLYPLRPAAPGVLHVVPEVTPAEWLAANSITLRRLAIHRLVVGRPAGGSTALPRLWESGR